MCRRHYHPKIILIKGSSNQNARRMLLPVRPFSSPFLWPLKMATTMRRHVQSTMVETGPSRALRRLVTACLLLMHSGYWSKHLRFVWAIDMNCQEIWIYHIKSSLIIYSNQLIPAKVCVNLFNEILWIVFMVSVWVCLNSLCMVKLFLKDFVGTCNRDDLWNDWWWNIEEFRGRIFLRTTLKLIL